MAADQSNSSTIHVALFSTKGAGLHYGGPGMTTYRLYNAARPGQFDITLVHGWVEQPKYDLFADQVFLSRMGKDPWTQFRLARRTQGWLRANGRRFDVFHGLQAFHLTVQSALVAENLGLPAVVKVAAHQTDLADKSGWRSMFALPRRRREIIKRLSGVIAISRDIAEELVAYGIPESKIARIPNGVDSDVFRPVADEAERRGLRQRFGWPDLPVIAFSGILKERKRPHLLIEALPLLKAQGHACHLVFAGRFVDPGYEAMFRSRLAGLTSPGDVTLLGFTDNTADLYRAADVFVLPSSSEGMPNALLEAMASGLPSVATRISGVTDAIEDGTHGLLIEPTPEALAEALASYLANPARRATHGAAARERVLSTFCASEVLGAYERMFRRIMAGGPAAE